MVLSVGPVIIGNEFGLWGLLALITFLLIYLIRPRPKKLNIPSIMFLFRQAGVARYTRFFRNFIRDWVFLIQLLALLALIGVLLSPFFWYDHDITSQNTVIVIDASASSKVMEGSSTRFDIARARAKELLGSHNTIILAKEVPLIGLQDASSQDAARYLDDLEPRDSPTRLGDSIILAGEVLANQEGRVIVLSDFVNTGGQDPNTAKLVLESKGLIVDFISTAGEDQRNIGFIDAVIDEQTSLLYIKNYDDSAVTATVRGPGLEQHIDLGAGEIAPVAFQTPPGTTQFTLSPEDAFMTDNDLWVSGPSEQNTKILIITNNRSVFLHNALRASPFASVDIATPPIVPTESYDIYVLHNIDPDAILPGTYQELEQEIRNGKTLIIHAQSNLAELNLGSLSPYTPTGFTDQAPIIIEQSTQYTRNIDFGIVNKAVALDGGSDMTTIASAGGEPLISIGNLGSGTVVYIGILEDSSDFRLSPAYPIFWHELLKFLTRQADVRTLNHVTGQNLILDHVQTITTPTDTLRQASILLDNEGLYHTEDHTLAANLLNERESAINEGEGVGQSAREYALVPVREQRQYDLEHALIVAALCILLFELVFIKLRGDL